MFSIQLDTVVTISDCPKSGLDAIDWRRAHGLPERHDNEQRLAWSGEDEEAFRAAIRAGMRFDSHADGSATVNAKVHGGWPTIRGGYTYSQDNGLHATVDYCVVAAHLQAPTAQTARDVILAVCARTQELIAEKAREAAAEDAKRDGEINEWLSRPREKQVMRSVGGDAFSYTTTVPYTIRDDLRVKARCAELAAYCKEREEADRAADRAAYELARVPWLAACRDYVIAHVPEFARAARDGKDVSGPAVKALRAEIVGWLDAAGLETVEYYQSREQATPRTLAYERLDATRAAISDRAGNHPLIKKITTEIERVDICEDIHTWRTAVRIWIELANGESPPETLDMPAVCGEESCSRRDIDGE